MKRQLTPFAKFIIVFTVIAGLFLAVKFASKSGLMNLIAPKGKGETSSKSSLFGGNKSSDEIRVGVVTWGGYAGGQYFNEGFNSSEESRFFKEYGIKVKFIVNDDFVSSREAFKAGEIDVLWGTIDSFPTEVQGLSAVEPRVIFQSDWSRGGDAIVGRRGIESVNDLIGKKVSVAFGTPSHTFLIWMLKSAGISYDKVTIVEAPSAIDSASYFKAGKVDAAVVWSPDDEDCVKNVPGAKIIISTKKASNIIADILFAKKEYIESHKPQLKSLIEGWMIGAAEINSSDVNKRKAAKILAAGLNQPEEFTYNAINNVRLATYGDNVNFFNINGDFKGIKGEDLYNSMAEDYATINLAPATVPSFRNIIDTSILRDITALTTDMHKGEESKKFEVAGEATKSEKAFSSKQVTITFPSGSYKLDENAKYIIQMQFGNVAKAFANARVRIEGNTDDRGSVEANKSLSKKRAESVAEFLISEYGFDSNRFTIVGNGSDKSVADNTSEEGRAKNRRTDFELLNGE